MSPIISVGRRALSIASSRVPSRPTSRSTAKFDFVVNPRTARALGLSPAAHFLSSPDEVIE
jgi:hypothetical protein